MDYLILEKGEKGSKALKKIDFFKELLLLLVSFLFVFIILRKDMRV